MRVLFLLMALSAFCFACERSKTPAPKKPEKAPAEDEGPSIIDHKNVEEGGSLYPRSNGKVPLQPPPTTTTPDNDNNAPDNLSSLWNGEDAFSNTDATLKAVTP